MLDSLAEQFEALLPDDLDYCSIRYMSDRGETISVRDDVVEPLRTSRDEGVMVSVWHGKGHGYAATSDLSDAGVRAAIDQARGWAERTAGVGVIDTFPQDPAAGDFSSGVTTPWDGVSLTDRIELVREHCARLTGDDRVAERAASISLQALDTVLVSTAGASIRQSARNVLPDLRVVVAADGRAQKRTFGGFCLAQQGGVEVLDRLGFGAAADTLTDEALELLTAPNCPSEVMDIILAPDQMALQIHESIGHPLELDRILGDERNFAGTSFVTMDMFGSYRYGSDLLNVTFDPTVPGELASYAFDDDGTPATKEYLIRDGILERPMGGAISQARSGMAGVANSRSAAWNRPPIDRMANLNVEPGTTPFADMIAGIERGVLLETNTSWSIDDSRNKFQFSCEKGTLIEDGELRGMVRNPSYRGISSQFWRSLSAVGDPDSFRVMGVPNCGKGEPSQVIWVGHASPPCRFDAIDVFGGES